MSDDRPKLVSKKSAGGGKTSTVHELNPDVIEAKSKELMAFLQHLADSDKIMALAVLQATLDACKRMWNIEGDIILSENPIQ